MKTIVDYRPQREACVLLLPEMCSTDGEQRAAIAYPDRHTRLFPNLPAALKALQEASR